MIVFTVLLVALGIALTFRLLHWLLRPMVRQRFWLRVSYLLMGAEFLVWTGWLFWVIRLLVRSDAVYVYFTMGIAFLLFGAVAWFLLRDVVAGIIFRLQHDLRANQSVQVADRAGRLLRLGATTLVLESTTGEQLKIPYTQLINQTVVRNEASDVVQSFDFLLQVPKTLSKDRWLRTLPEQVLLLPWASAQRRPVVQWQSEGPETHTFELRVHSLNAQHAQLIENHLRHVHTDANV